jgi:hypothetical protein
MEEEKIIRKYEYDDEGRIVKEEITTTYKTAGNIHPFKQFWTLDNEDDIQGMI